MVIGVHVDGAQVNAPSDNFFLGNSTIVCDLDDIHYYAVQKTLI